MAQRRAGMNPQPVPAVLLACLVGLTGCFQPAPSASWEITWTTDMDEFRQNDTRVEEWERSSHADQPGPMLRVLEANRTGKWLTIQGAIGLHDAATWGSEPFWVGIALKREPRAEWDWRFEPTVGQASGYVAKVPVETGEGQAEILIEQMQGDHGAKWDRYEITMQQQSDGWNVTFEVDRHHCTYGPATFFLTSCDGRGEREYF